MTKDLPKDKGLNIAEEMRKWGLFYSSSPIKNESLSDGLKLFSRVSIPSILELKSDKPLGPHEHSARHYRQDIIALMAEAPTGLASKVLYETLKSRQTDLAWPTIELKYDFKTHTLKDPDDVSE